MNSYKTAAITITDWKSTKHW